MELIREQQNLQKERLSIQTDFAEVNMKLCISTAKLAKLERLQLKLEKDLQVKNKLSQDTCKKYANLNQKKKLYLILLKIFWTHILLIKITFLEMKKI